MDVIYMSTVLIYVLTVFELLLYFGLIINITNNYKLKKITLENLNRGGQIMMPVSLNSYPRRAL
jgi:hypothetical protein